MDSSLASATRNDQVIEFPTSQSQVEPQFFSHSCVCFHIIFKEKLLHFLWWYTTAVHLVLSTWLVCAVTYKMIRQWTFSQMM